MLNAATIQSTMVNGGRWPASLPFDDFFLALSFIDTAPSFFPYHLPDHAARHNVWRQSMPFPANGQFRDSFISASQLRTSPVTHWRLLPPAASPAPRSARRPPWTAPRRTESRTG